VAVLGMTFKEDCPDVRNSKVIDIINELNEYGIDVFVTDPIADENEIKEEYGVELTKFEDIKDMDAIIVAVGHKQYLNLDLQLVKKLYSVNDTTYNNDKIVDEAAITKESTNDKEKLVLVDVKGVFNKKEAESKNYLYWRL
ncbi:MAG: UDP binding domain-containing protein, partial [Clostridiales bacterium]|nr:UDP binding domain-containing protein [Clostridiales bacterium]